MLRLLAPYRIHLQGKAGALGALFLLGLLGSAASLAAPLLGREFVDAVATRGEFAAIPRIAAGLVGLAAVDLALGVVTSLAHARLSARILVELRERLFDRCLSAPLEHLETFRHGDLMSRFGADISRVQGLFVDGLLGGLQNLLFLGVAAAILLQLSPPLALWSFLGVGSALAVTVAFRSPVEQGSRGVREAMADLSHFLSERLGAMRPIRLHDTRHEERTRFSSLNARLVRKVLSFQLLDAAASGLPGLALTLSLAWIYLRGGPLLEAKTISLGTFVAFVLYQGRLFGPARGLLGLVRSLQEARVSLERVAEVLEHPEPLAPERIAAGEQDSSDLAILFHRVGFAYSGKAPVFTAFDWQVKRGERVAIFGPSGVGKSTLVQLLFGLRSPSTGHLQILGVSATTPGLSARIGYAGCEPFLLHASIEENIRYGRPGASGEEVADAARLAAAHGFILSLPDGYRAVIGGRGLTLSDGQRQRIGMARLLLQQPQILVLDEAFSGLDPATERRVRDNLWRSFPEQTIVSVSHRLEDLEAFDRLFFLSEAALHPCSAGEIRRRMASWTEAPHFAVQPSPGPRL